MSLLLATTTLNARLTRETLQRTQDNSTTTGERKHHKPNKQHMQDKRDTYVNRTDQPHGRSPTSLIAGGFRFTTKAMMKFYPLRTFCQVAESQRFVPKLLTRFPRLRDYLREWLRTREITEEAYKRCVPRGNQPNLDRWLVHSTKEPLER